MSSEPAIPPLLLETLRRAESCARARRAPCYLVGGLLRDQLLGRPLPYLNADLAVPQQALALAQRLAAETGGAFVPLDPSTRPSLRSGLAQDSAPRDLPVGLHEAAGCGRVVVARDGARVEVDVADFRAPTLEADLALRDFTVNAIAVDLAAWLRAPERPGPLIDPLGGVQALRERRLTPCFPGTFDADPVRILRAFRFVAQLDFTLDPDASPLMRAAAPSLTRVSGERIRDELLAIFETDRAAPAIQALDELGVLDVLVPELVPGRGLFQGGYHHLDVLGHQLETVAQADRMLADFAEFSVPLRAPMAAYCADELVERRSRKSLIKLAGLLHDVGKPARRTVEADGEIWFLGHEHTGAELVVGIVERLRLSNRESEMVRQLVLHHLRPGFLSREPQLTRRAIYRLFKDLGDNGPGCLLTWWADRMATRGSKSRLDQLDQQRARLEELLNAYFFQAEEVVKPPRLVDGHRLMAAFSLAPGPVIGELLDAIEEAQAEGRIRSAEDALALAKMLVETKRPG